MNKRPPLSEYAHAHVHLKAFGGWRWLAAAPLALAAIGGLGWADAPALLVKALIVTVLTSAVVLAVYLCFRRKMR